MPLLKCNGGCQWRKESALRRHGKTRIYSWRRSRESGTLRHEKRRKGQRVKVGKSVRVGKGGGLRPEIDENVPSLPGRSLQFTLWRVRGLFSSKGRETQGAISCLVETVSARKRGGGACGPCRTAVSVGGKNECCTKGKQKGVTRLAGRS